jgi:fumarylpyruvate hydrolase
MSEFVVPAPPQVSAPVHGGGRFPVRRIYCVGRNYLEHIREMGGDERDPPFFFQKPADAIVAAGNPEPGSAPASVPYPQFTSDFQYEVELVLAIGKPGSNIAKPDAASHVFGVAVGIDLTRRDVQVAARKSGRPWEIGKAFDHSAPLAPILRLQGGLPTSGAISLEVDGEVKQSGDLSQLIWSCEEIVVQLSAQYRLEAGDLIYTGTPAGVGPVVPGNVLFAQIDGLPTLLLRIEE